MAISNIRGCWRLEQSFFFCNTLLASGHCSLVTDRQHCPAYRTVSCKMLLGRENLWGK